MVYIGKNTKTKRGAKIMSKAMQLELFPTLTYYNTLGFDKELIDYINFVNDSVENLDIDYLVADLGY